MTDHSKPETVEKVAEILYRRCSELARDGYAWDEAGGIIRQSYLSVASQVIDAIIPAQSVNQSQAKEPEASGGLCAIASHAVQVGEPTRIGAVVGDQEAAEPSLIPKLIVSLGRMAERLRRMGEYEHAPPSLIRGEADLLAKRVEELRGALSPHDSALMDGLKAAIRAAKLALFVIRKQDVMPNSSWQSGFDQDLATAETALANQSQEATTEGELTGYIGSDPGDARDIARAILAKYDVKRKL